MVEHPTFRLRGWAAQVEAVNLVTRQREPALDPRVDDRIEALASCGYKSYGDDWTVRTARQYLAEPRHDGLLDVDVIVSAVAARGVGADGVKRLREQAVAAQHGR